MQYGNKGLFMKNKKMSEWYFEGYEIKTVTKNGKIKKVYGEYKGKYYSLGMDAAVFKRFRIQYFSLFILYLALYLFISLWPTYAASTWPGMFNLLNLIPVLYLIIGSGYFLMAKPEMTVRTVYSSVKAIVRSLYVVLILSILAFISDIFTAGNAGNIFGGNSVYLAGSLVCAAIAAVLVAIWKKHPCREIQSRK